MWRFVSEMHNVENSFVSMTGLSSKGTYCTACDGDDWPSRSPSHLTINPLHLSSNEKIEGTFLRDQPRVLAHVSEYQNMQKHTETHGAVFLILHFQRGKMQAKGKRSKKKERASVLRTNATLQLWNYLDGV